MNMKEMLDDIFFKKGINYFFLVFWLFDNIVLFIGVIWFGFLKGGKGFSRI